MKDIKAVKIKERKNQNKQCEQKSYRSGQFFCVYKELKEILRNDYK